MRAAATRPHSTRIHAASTAASLLSTLVLAACGASEEVSRSATVRDSAGIRIVENGALPGDDAPRWRVAESPSLELGAVDGPAGEQLFGVVGAARLADGRWAVLNGGTRQLLFYGPDGRPLGSAGGEGEGPGEFRAPSRLHALPGDTLLVWDLPLGRLHRFDGAGEFLDTEESRFRENEGLPGHPYATEVAEVLPDGSVLVFAYPVRPRGEWPVGRHRPELLLTWLAPDGSATRLGTYGGLEQDLVIIDGGRPYPIIPPYARELALAIPPAAGLPLVLGEQTTPGFERFERGRLTGIVRWTSPDPPVTAEDIRAWETRTRKWAAGFGSEEAFERARAKATLTKTRSPYGPIHVDASGHVWVGEAVPDWRTLPRTFDVYAPDGAWTARVDVPPVRILDIGTAHIAGVYRDEMEVEFLRVYALERSPGS